MIELVIFDMDGLMFDTERVCMELFLEIGKSYGLSLEEEHYINTIAATHEQVTEYLSSKFGTDKKELFQTIFRECMEQMKERSLKEPMPMKKGLIELLDYLDAHHYLKTVASASPLDTIHRYLEGAEIADRFQFVISGDQCKEGKPNPEIFLRACEHFHTHPDHAVVLEDSRNGIIAAKRAHIKCIAIPDLMSYDEEWSENYYKKRNHLGEVIDVLEKLNRGY